MSANLETLDAVIAEMDAQKDGGNGAALREALQKIAALTEPCEGVTECEIMCNTVAKAALSAPPRNCDRPECATVQGADEEFCKAGERDHSLGKCWEDLCYWLLAPAERREGGAK